jgi:hypothetical protein
MVAVSHEPTFVVERIQFNLLNINGENNPAINNISMKNGLYIIALILILVWSIGFIGYGIGGAFHSILFVALSMVVMRVLLEKKLIHKHNYSA